MASDDEVLDLYFYNPSTAAAVVFSVLYLLLTLYHFHISILYARKQPIKHRYTIPLFVAAFISTAGWSVRIASIQNKSSISLYATSASYVVISPIFVCATLYLLLTRLIRSSLPDEPAHMFFRVPPRWLGRIFITSDIFSFLTQCSGSGIASSGNWEGSLKEVGTNVLLVGLALQLATFSTFLLVLGRVVRRVNRSRHTEFDPRVKKVILGVWIASLFVQVSTLHPTEHITMHAISLPAFPPDFPPSLTCANVFLLGHSDPIRLPRRRIRPRNRRLPFPQRMVSLCPRGRAHVHRHCRVGLVLSGQMDAAEIARGDRARERARDDGSCFEAWAAAKDRGYYVMGVCVAHAFFWEAIFNDGPFCFVLRRDDCGQQGSFGAQDRRQYEYISRWRKHSKWTKSISIIQGTGQGCPLSGALA